MSQKNTNSISRSVDGSGSEVGLLRRLRRNRKGAIAAEFAIVTPALMGLMFGTIEYGMVLFSFSSMQSAARDVTRQVAVNTLSFAGAKAEMKSRLPVWMQNNAVITFTQTNAANPAVNVYTAKLEVDASKSTPLTFYTKVTDWKLSTEVEMKQELPFVETPVT